MRSCARSIRARAQQVGEGALLSSKKAWIPAYAGMTD